MSHRSRKPLWSSLRSGWREHVMNLRLFAMALALVAGPLCAAIPAAPDRRQGVGPYPQLILRGVTVINGTGSPAFGPADIVIEGRSEEHTSELQSLMRISYAVFCLKKKRSTRHDTYTY